VQLIDMPGFAARLVIAASEAAIVGGLADWFAVTALFRHPLGLPIPHTALIPSRKNAIGRSLGNFVRDQFLDSRSWFSVCGLRTGRSCWRGGWTAKRPPHSSPSASWTSSSLC